MWWTILPFVLVTVAVVVLPGFVVNFAAGLRPVQAVGYAPLASVGLIEQIPWRGIFLTPEGEKLAHESRERLHLPQGLRR